MQIYMRTLASLGMSGLLALVGCGTSGPAMYPVTGSVTVDEQPVENGSIVFFPQDGQGATAGGEITAGKYTIQCTPGAKRVEISATKEISTGGPESMPDFVSITPAKYNTDSELTATVAEGENVFDFSLSSK
jgi:hypothetical protein